MDATKYLYEVRPTRVVRIPGKRATLRHSTVLLTKNEVKDYMKYGAVYRKTVTGKIYKVTGENLNQLHAPMEGEAPAPKPVQQHNPSSNLQPKSDNNQNWKRDKKNKHNNGNNYRDDERGKTVVNANDAQPQFNNNTSTETSESGSINVVF